VIAAETGLRVAPRHRVSPLVIRDVRARRRRRHLPPTAVKPSRLQRAAAGRPRNQTVLPAHSGNTSTWSAAPQESGGARPVGWRRRPPQWLQPPVGRGVCVRSRGRVESRSAASCATRSRVM
jgi:hypothetical protein